MNAAALPGPADLAALYGALEALAALNPHPDTATSTLINGRQVTVDCAVGRRGRGVAATAEGWEVHQHTRGSSAGAAGGHRATTRGQRGRGRSEGSARGI